MITDYELDLFYFIKNFQSETKTKRVDKQLFY